MGFRERMGLGTALRDAAERSARQAHHHAMRQLDQRRESEPAAAALAKVYLNLAYDEKARPTRFGGLSGDVTRAVEEAMRRASPGISQTDIDHLTDRALSLARWPGRDTGLGE